MCEISIESAGLGMYEVSIKLTAKDGRHFESTYVSLEASSTSAFTEGTRRAESHFQDFKALSVTTKRLSAPR